MGLNNSSLSINIIFRGFFDNGIVWWKFDSFREIIMRIFVLRVCGGRGGSGRGFLIGMEGVLDNMEGID